MRRRLSPERYRQVIELLAAGESVSQTSRLAHVGYEAVKEIAAGTRSAVGPQSYHPSADRCPGCGRKIYVWPCLGCMVTGKSVGSLSTTSTTPG